MLKLLRNLSLLISVSVNVYALEELSFKYEKKNLLQVGVDHSSYYNSGVTNSGLRFSYQKNDGPLKVDFFGIMHAQEGLENRSQFTWSIPELYYKFGFFSLGRKIFNNTDYVDLNLNGFWNNAWDYRKDEPIEEGLMGLFYERKGKKSQHQFFVSPLSIPKLTSHYEFENDGQVNATTPWFALPPEQITYSGNRYDVKYFLNDIDYAALVLKPQVGLNSLFNLSTSSQLRLTYLYAPSKDVDLGLAFLVDASSELTPIELNISPETSYFHKLGAEFSKKWNSVHKTTLNVSAQQRQDDLPINQDVSWIGLGDGVYSFLVHELNLKRSKLHFFANLSTIGIETRGELDEVLRDSLSINYRYNSGLGFGLKQRLSQKWAFNISSYFDLEQEGAFGRVSVQTNRRAFSFEAGLSFVEAFSANSEGFYKDFRENDQLYTRFGYVF